MGRRLLAKGSLTTGLVILAVVAAVLLIPMASEIRESTGGGGTAYVDPITEEWRYNVGLTVDYYLPAVINIGENCEITHTSVKVDGVSFGVQSFWDLYEPYECTLLVELEDGNTGVVLKTFNTDVINNKLVDPSNQQKSFSVPSLEDGSYVLKTHMFNANNELTSEFDHFFILSGGVMTVN